jgi:hypothetical protein
MGQALNFASSEKYVGRVFHFEVQVIEIFLHC